ncbi:DnaD domain protein [Clostridium magnum]|uniref:Replication initiation and membrane attachment n=1 Tax=Clostridium magnum DSM 2767 TaxID=1121326 RepID=A0A162QNK1_9CLOT|nr:DnaD domain protein [Clostridium magnum]KZL88665.1 replication initiation and membrane attachment [Clostridium magnum DSM 2767]KZL88755.1 replication initiation and membrane attachment [Clostridium magnum DSM 2767]SHJ60269.1 DnaD and phage-associated domain-containing protein [Clostridium magnum DSM 2767]
MAVFRVKKDKDNPYIVINKNFIYDKRISLKAKGLMAYFLSRPDNWEFYINEICENTSDKHRCISNTIKELEAYGYVTRDLKRSNTGKFAGGYDYIVYETPIDPKCQNVDSAKCQSGETPIWQKGSLLNNDNKLNNDINNNKDLNPIQVYQENIFHSPGKLELDSLNSWSEQLSDKLVILAINIAAKNNARRLEYIEKILMDWDSRGIKTTEQAQVYTMQRNKKSKKGEIKGGSSSEDNQSSQGYNFKRFGG